MRHRFVTAAGNGVAPTLSSLADGTYPPGKGLFLVVRASSSDPFRRFASFLTTPEAQRILRETGNLPLPLPPLE